MQKKHRQALSARSLEKHCDAFAHNAAHAATHESEHEPPKCYVYPVNARTPDFDRFIRIGALFGTRYSFRVLLSVVKTKWIARFESSCPSIQMPAVEQQVLPAVMAQPMMVATGWAYLP
jgi:hypothetical protein